MAKVIASGVRKVRLTHSFQKKTKMVNTQNRLHTSSEGYTVIESTNNQPEGMDQIPSTVSVSSKPLMTESTLESRMMDSMMRAMNAAMAQQQEFFIKLLEDVYARKRVENEMIGEKRKLEGNSMPSKKLKIFNDNCGVDSKHEASWCSQCRNKHFGPCNFVPVNCSKCGKPGHVIKNCPIKGKTCFECKDPGHIRRKCPNLKVGGSDSKKVGSSRVSGSKDGMTRKG